MDRSYKLILNFSELTQAYVESQRCIEITQVEFKLEEAPEIPLHIAQYLFQGITYVQIMYTCTNSNQILRSSKYLSMEMLQVITKF